MFFRNWKARQLERKNKEIIKEKLFDLYTSLQLSRKELTDTDKTLIGGMKGDQPKYEAFRRYLDLIRNNLIQKSFQTQSLAEMRGLQWSASITNMIGKDIDEMYNNYILINHNNAKTTKEGTNW